MMRPAIAGGLAGVIIGLLWPIALHAAELDGWARPAHVLSIFALLAAAIAGFLSWIWEKH